MTTTELIELLKQHEFGASGRPREISISICPVLLDTNDVDMTDEEEQMNLMLYDNHEIKVSGGGDGIAGAQLDLRIETLK